MRRGFTGLEEKTGGHLDTNVDVGPTASEDSALIATENCFPFCSQRNYFLGVPGLFAQQDGTSAAAGG